MRTTALPAQDARVIPAINWSAIGMLFFGLFLIYAVGFSTLPVAHNAAHDTRHSNGFPCH